MVWPVEGGARRLDKTFATAIRKRYTSAGKEVAFAEI